MNEELQIAAKGSLKDRRINIHTGDNVKVYQKVTEGGKQRIQVFNGLVINTKRPQSVTSSITLRRVASGVGVEKTFLLNSPMIERIQIVRSGKVRRKYLTFIRKRSGKSARLTGRDLKKGMLTDELLIPETVDEQVPEETEVVSDEATAEAPVEEASPAEIPVEEAITAEDDKN